MALDDSISVLAKDAARHPEKIGEYLDFLCTLGRVSQEATPEQKAAIRSYAEREVPLPGVATAHMKQLMGWAP